MNILRTATRSFMWILLSLFVFQTSTAFASDVSKITKEQLKKQLVEKNVTILDTRRGNDWDASDFKILNAHRAAPENFNAWSATYPKTDTLVLYCA